MMILCKHATIHSKPKSSYLCNECEKQATQTHPVKGFCWKPLYSFSFNPLCSFPDNYDWQTTFSDFFMHLRGGNGCPPEQCIYILLAFNVMG